jgi:hypothetical protein
MTIKTKLKQAGDLVGLLVTGQESAIRDELRDCLANGCPTRVVKVVALMFGLIRDLEGCDRYELSERLTSLVNTF